jgi:ParB family chromosome partitioning protein
VEGLPILLDSEEAIDYYQKHPSCTDAVKSYIVGFLHNEGLTNPDIRSALGLKVYQVTHLKRVGTSLTESELETWHKNPRSITLGHLRAIAKFPYNERIKLLDDLKAGKEKKKKGKKSAKSVSAFEAKARGEAETKDADIKRYEELMQEVTGRVTKIKYNATKQSGSITLDFFSLDSLDDISKALGFDASKHDF